MISADIIKMQIVVMKKNISDFTKDSICVHYTAGEKIRKVYKKSASNKEGASCSSGIHFFKAIHEEERVAMSENSSYFGLLDPKNSAHLIYTDPRFATNQLVYLAI